MAKKAGADLWKDIQDSAPAGWLILDEGDEIPEVTLISSHNVIEPGDTDMHGKVWEKEWTKNEIKVKKRNGETAVLSLGWNTGAFLRTFIGKWQEHGLTPDTLIGTKWYIKHVSKYDYDIRYLGREDEVATATSTSTQTDEDPSYTDVKDTILSLSSEPSVSGGLKEDDFVTAVAIKAGVPKSKVSGYVKKLLDEQAISIKEDKIVLN